MPVVLREGPYRFFFYSGDRDEPHHVHVASGNQVAKPWLDPVILERSGRLRRSEIRRIERMVGDDHDPFCGGLEDYFND